MVMNDNLEILVRGLIALPKEKPYVEFKMNESDPNYIGIRIAALSNMAALSERSCAYMVWGIDDSTHEIHGTSVHFSNWKKGNEDIIPYWRNMLSPRIELYGHDLVIDGKDVAVLEIQAASYVPTKYQSIAYCRIDTYTKPLKDYPETERRLWSILDHLPAELRSVAANIGANEAEELMDVAGYFHSVGRNMPSTEGERTRYLLDEGFLSDSGYEKYSITALGALLFGKDIGRFRSLEGKQIRIVRYEGNDRLWTKGREAFANGYALSFEQAFVSIMKSIQSADQFSNGIRVDAYRLPPIAVREALTNAIIHQDLLEGYGPLIEVFQDRIEVSSAGDLGVSPDRIIDIVPKPRNKALAMFLRRINIGDSAGSGFDKMALAMEKEHLMAPLIEENPTGVRLTLFMEKTFDTMSQDEKLLCLYDHAVLKYLDHRPATNGSVRERFGLPVSAKYQISRLLSISVEKGLLKKKEDSGKKDAFYLPYWA